MRLSAVYSQLLKLGVPVIRTIDAAAALKISINHASQLLKRLADDEFISSIRRGYWAFSSLKDPYVILPFLTAPYPAYISLQTALNFHGIISQIPSVHYAVSLARSCQINTAFGQFSIHHVNADFFFGYEAIGLSAIKIASPEKALMDILYLRQNQPKLFKALPELELSGKFKPKICRKILQTIRSEKRRKAIAQWMKTLL